HLANRELGDVVRGHTVHERHRVRTLDDELAHVTHVKEAALRPHRVVLCDEPGRVADGHGVAGKGHHLGAKGQVELVEGSFLHALEAEWDTRTRRVTRAPIETRDACGGRDARTGRGTAGGAICRSGRAAGSGD